MIIAGWLGLFKGFIFYSFILSILSFGLIFSWDVLSILGRKKLVWLFGSTKMHKDTTGIGPRNWREKIISRSAKFSPVLVYIITAVLVGPLLSWPIFNSLGFSKRKIYISSFISSWVFSGVWFPFYALGAKNLDLVTFGLFS